MSIPGWGSGEWGASGWGDGSGGPAVLPTLELQSVTASRENAVQLTFNLPVYFSGVLDPNDGSFVNKYLVLPVAGTIGMDGTAARPVDVMQVLPVPAAVTGLLAGRVLEVTLDRPMTAYPAEYSVIVTGLFSADLAAALDPAFTSAACFGAYRLLSDITVDDPVPFRDFANPQDFGAALAAGLANPQDPNNLGTQPIDGTGDYATDSGIVGYKKRILRRLQTRPGGFLHLGKGYGVGVTRYGKKNMTPAVRGRLAAEAEAQIMKEPETKQVRVRALVDPLHPGVVRFQIIAQMRTGATVQMAAPFVLA